MVVGKKINLERWFSLGGQTRWNIGGKRDSFGGGSRAVRNDPRDW